MPALETFEPGAAFADDFDGTVVEAKFGTREKYNDKDGNPQPLLLLKLDNEEATEVAFSLGKGWTIDGDGESVSREDGVTKFAASSMIQRLIARCKQLWPAWLEYGPVDARDARQYLGTRWHWKQEKVEYGGRLQDREHLFPATFIGTVAVEGGGGGAGAGGGDDLEAELAVHAMTAENHTAFVKAVLNDKPLAEKVKAKKMLPAIMNKSATGFFESHKG